MISIGLGNTTNNYNSRKDLLLPSGYKQSYHSLVISTLAINILSLALPVMTLQVYDRILPNPGTGTLPVLITGVCLAILLEATLRLCRSYIIGRSGASYEHRLACETMNKILGADLSKIGKYGIGEYLHRMGSVGKLKDFYNGYALTVLAELAFIPLFFGLIFYIGGYLAYIPATILTVFIAFSIIKGIKLRDTLSNRETTDDRRFNFLIETLEGVHTLKAFALEKFFQRRYEAMEEKSTCANYRVMQQMSGTFNTGAIFSHIMVASVITVGAWFVLKGFLTTGALIAVLLLSGRIMQPIQKGLALWTRYQDYKLARHSLEGLIQTPQKEITLRIDQVTAPHPDGRLKIENLNYAPNGAAQSLLNNINLNINRGDCILISGAHGSGKTSLLKLIAGIYPPSSGEIIIDDENIKTYQPHELVNHVGYIRSRPLIFRGTIRDNMTCFGQINEAKAKEIAALLEVDKDVAKLPGGFDTFIQGNSADTITPGLKQRIAIVRVLATKPRLILFDNADRSLDKDGYAMIYSLLARLKGKASLILISNDQNICSLAEHHYILEGGQLLKQDEIAEQTNVKPYKELRL